MTRLCIDSAWVIAWRTHQTRVGDELDVALRIEPARRLHQPEIAFVDQIEERHAEAAIALRVADDEAKVAFDQPPQRLLVAVVLDARGRAPALRPASAAEARDVAQVGLQRIAFRPRAIRQSCDIEPIRKRELRRPSRA